MPDYAKLFDQVCSRPGMFVMEPSYLMVTAFIDGYNTACEGGVLDGFREWMIVKSDRDSNFHWARLVLDFAFPDVGDPDAHLAESTDNDQVALNALRTLLADFFAVKQEGNGARAIYVSYEGWLRRQPWYDEECPDWCPL